MDTEFNQFECSVTRLEISHFCKEFLALFFGWS